MPKPDYRLMARSGVPAGELLLAQRQLDPPADWTWLDYGVLVTLLLMQAGAAIVLCNLAVDLMWGAK